MTAWVLVTDSAATGLIVALLCTGATAAVADVPLFAAVACGLLFPLVAAFSVHHIHRRFSPTTATPRNQLVAIAYLTLLLPLFGALFGAPNLELNTLAVLWLLGAVGGALWSLPLLLWTLRARVCQCQCIDVRAE